MDVLTSWFIADAKMDTEKSKVHVYPCEVLGVFTNCFLVNAHINTEMSMAFLWSIG